MLRDFTDFLLVMFAVAVTTIAAILYAIAHLLTPRDRR
jgi:hypothetical protein